MANPFYQRISESVRDDLAFLSVVAPEPVTRFLKKDAENGALYNRLTVICGSPGSGKTTLARLFEYGTVSALLKVGPQRGGAEPFKDLMAALAECNVIQGRHAQLVGCRLQLESEYRDFWECPYPDKLKTRLMLTLLQARAVLAWIRHLEGTGVPLESVSIVAREDAEAGVAAIGGHGARGILERARRVEAAAYRVVASLVPPAPEKLDDDATGAYQPFDVIKSFIILEHGVQHELKPLVIFDDAQELHRDQYVELVKWLSRRELRLARWILTRLDVMTPNEALVTAAFEAPDETAKNPGLKIEREVIVILLQGGPLRSRRKGFHTMARDMANRYLRQWPLFSERNLVTFSHLLSTDLGTPTEKVIQRLSDETDLIQSRLGIGKARRDILEQSLHDYLEGSTRNQASIEDSVDVWHFMLRILMQRFVKRNKGPELFPTEELGEEQAQVAANSSVHEAACLQLLHEEGRPYYFGMEKLCDCGSENAELFLHLAGSLAERCAAEITRKNSALLSSKTQNQQLRERAGEIIGNWNFPWFRQVTRLLDFIGSLCLKETLSPNGWLTPNAYGIPQQEFEAVVSDHPDLAATLQFAIARNALSLNVKYSCKGKQWCLIELGGVAILRFGLSLRRGGFVEGTVSALANVIKEGGQS